MPLTQEERLANLARGRERSKEVRARQKEERAAEAEAPAPDLLAQIQAMLSSHLEPLAERLKKLEGELPQPVFRPQPLPDAPYVPVPSMPGPGAVWNDPNGRQVVGHLDDWMGSDGRPASRGPRFAVGQKVRLVRAAHHGTAAVKRVRKKEEDGTPAVDEEGRPIFVREFTPLSWGEVLDRIGQLHCGRMLARNRPCRTPFTVGQACPSCGNAPEIVRVVWETKSGGWKYRVKIPGLTSGRSSEGLLDYEIEAA